MAVCQRWEGASSPVVIVIFTPGPVDHGKGFQGRGSKAKNHPQEFRHDTVCHAPEHLLTPLPPVYKDGEILSIALPLCTAHEMKPVPGIVFGFQEVF